jgi:hypothetical protein
VVGFVVVGFVVAGVVVAGVVVVGFEVGVEDVLGFVVDLFVEEVEAKN